MLYHQVGCYNLFSFIVVMLLPQCWYYSLLFLYVLADVLPLFVMTDGIATFFGCCDVDCIGRSYAKWWCTTDRNCCILADVIAKVAGVIVTVGDSSCLADVNAKVADGMPTMCVDWQML